MLILKIFQLTGQSILGGAFQGEMLLPELLAMLKRQHWTPPIVIDFGGIELVTASYLRTSVLAFRAFVQMEYSDTPLIVANINSSIQEELAMLMELRGEAIVASELLVNELRNARILGHLDEMLGLTLHAILKHVEAVDARTLAENSGDVSQDGKRFTKWNNRLAALASYGILMPVQHGRIKKYKPVVGGMKYGA